VEPTTLYGLGNWPELLGSECSVTNVVEPIHHLESTSPVGYRM
jgi:hypothetical protein